MSSPSEEKEEAPTADSIAAMKAMFHDTKVDGGKKSAWTMTLETFGMADGGKHKQEDVVAETLESAMESIQSMLAAEKDEHPKWQFTLTPLDQFNATFDDVLHAFLQWAKKDDDEATYNVSKAFRRLDSYATWMEEHRLELEQPLTVDSIRAAAHAWQLKLSHDSKGRMLWWIEFGSLDVSAIKTSIPHEDSLRFMVWISHIIMLDKQAQENGIVIVQDMGKKGLIESMTVVPMDLGTQMDRLTIGVLPIKMKACYILDYRRWLSILMGLMRPFMSKKMRSRIILITKKQDPQAVLDEEFGRVNIPVGFGGLEGTMEDDIVFGQYVK
jgi:hypothetical protein